MNEEHTIEALGLCLDKQDHIDSVVYHIMAEDVVIYGDNKISSDIVLDSLKPLFKRRLVHLIMDSQNPVSSKVRDAIEEKAIEMVTEIVNGLEKPF